jgi:outer membrane protein assembly factor BamB
MIEKILPGQPPLQGTGKSIPTALSDGGKMEAPRDTLSRAPGPDPLIKQMADVSALTQRTAAGVLFNDDRDKLVRETLTTCALWADKKDHTSNTDAVYDPATKTLYTGVEPRGPSDFNYWHLRAYNTDGTEKWTYRGDYVKSRPVIDDEGNIYVRSNGFVRVLHPDGHEISTIPVKHDDWNSTPPALGPDGEIYFIAGNPDAIGSYEPNLRVFAFKEGKELWHYDAAGDYTADHHVIVGKDGTVFLSAEHHRRARTFGGLLGVENVKKPALIGINGKDGKERFVTKVKGWDSYTEGNLTEGPDGTIFAFHGDKNLSAFSPKGKEKWHYVQKDQPHDVYGRSRFFQDPTFDADGNLYIGTATTSSFPEGYLICLDKEGNEKWNVPVPGGITTKAKVGPDGNVYCGSGNGNMLAFDRGTGQETGRHSIGSFYANNFSFGDDGEIYVTTDKNVLALQFDSKKLTEKLTDDRKKQMQEESDAIENAVPKVSVEEEFVDIDGIKLPRFMKKL